MDLKSKILSLQNCLNRIPFQLVIHGKASDFGGLLILFSSYEIEIPEYESKETLREKLLIAIFEGSDGFFMS